MRRRTADFLQGEYLNYSLAFATILTPRSTQQGETGERGKGAEDSKRSNIQSPGMTISVVPPRPRGRPITVAWLSHASQR